MRKSAVVSSLLRTSRIILLNNQRDAVLSSRIYFHCEVTLHVWGAFCTHHQEYN
jgi:hypothetical protein